MCLLTTLIDCQDFCDFREKSTENGVNPMGLPGSQRVNDAQRVKAMLLMALSNKIILEAEARSPLNYAT